MLRFGERDRAAAHLTLGGHICGTNRLLAQGRYRLTPLYDVLSAWSSTGPGANQVHRKKLKLAMALRGTQKH